MEKEEIVQCNQKGEYHGYQQWHHQNDNHTLKLRGVFKHGLEIGYEEWHKYYSTAQTTFYIR